MMCAWEAFMNLLPIWMRENVNSKGKETLQNLRLRVGQPPILVTSDKQISLSKTVTAEDLQFCINIASRYSPWSATTVTHGYITAQGGHRLGICGEAATLDGAISCIRVPTSICLRVARDFPGIAGKIKDLDGSILIIGKPGCGKTTLLRDVIRQKSNAGRENISVVDEREELFPRYNKSMCFPIGINTDVISGCSKAYGIDLMLRSMGPDIIAVDEITAHEDCTALLHVGWCGIKLLATAHASSRYDLLNRPVYRPIVESGLFDYLVVLHQDKSWCIERMNI